MCGCMCIYNPFFSIILQVEILVGKDKGKQGIVKEIYQERNWIIVEGLNTKLKCMMKDKTFPGIYTQQEQPLLVTSQVQLVDPADMFVHLLRNSF